METNTTTYPQRSLTALEAASLTASIFTALGGDLAVVDQLIQAIRDNNISGQRKVVSEFAKLANQDAIGRALATEQPAVENAIEEYNKAQQT